jgi:hypothetical protein
MSTFGKEKQFIKCFSCETSCLKRLQDKKHSALCIRDTDFIQFQSYSFLNCLVWKLDH